MKKLLLLSSLILTLTSCEKEELKDLNPPKQTGPTLPIGAPAVVVEPGTIYCPSGTFDTWTGECLD